MINIATFARLSITSIFVLSVSPSNAASRYLCEERWAHIVILDDDETPFNNGGLVPTGKYVIEMTGDIPVWGDAKISIIGQGDAVEFAAGIICDPTQIGKVYCFERSFEMDLSDELFVYTQMRKGAAIFSVGDCTKF